MSLNPSQISAHIKAMEFSVAEQALIEFIEFNVNEKNQMLLKSTTENVFAVQKTTLQDNQQLLEKICSEYAFVISELYCHPKYSPTTRMTETLMTYKFVLDWIFSVSVWKTTDAIIDHLKLLNANKAGQVSTNQQNIVVLLSLISLGSRHRLPWAFLFKVNPAIALSAYIGLVTQPIPALTKETSDGFNYLLEAAKGLPILELPVIKDLGKLNYGFFNCSYATSEHKYEFKKWLTTLIRQNLIKWTDDEVKEHTANVTPLKIAGKIKIGVMLELYSKNHAMYRCYNAFLTSLAKHYDLVAFIDEAEVSKADLSAFKQVVTFDNVFAINENAKRIIQNRPDILFYPSIGMKFWGIYLSQLRLAPLQVMMGGHPSGSFSPHIDYFLMVGNTHNADDIQPFYTEKVMCPQSRGNSLSTHTIDDKITEDFLLEHRQFKTSHPSGEMVIGINGILTKVTVDIINVCKRLQNLTNKKLVFIFFSGHTSSQLAYIAAKNQLARELKNFELVSFTDYVEYMSVISRCDFLLPTIPFGGTNSNVDAMLLNKPKLFIKGNSFLYTRCDHEEWERVGLAEDFGCKSTDELIDKALRLVEEPDYRKELFEKMAVQCPLEKICVPVTQNNYLLVDLFAQLIDVLDEK